MQLRTTRGEIAKRAYELELVPDHETLPNLRDPDEPHQQGAKVSVVVKPGTQQVAKATTRGAASRAASSSFHQEASSSMEQGYHLDQNLCGTGPGAAGPQGSIILSGTVTEGPQGSFGKRTSAEMHSEPSPPRVRGRRDRTGFPLFWKGWQF